MANEDYDAALADVKEMQEICSRAPVLNYMTGILYRRAGDETKALFYLQMATASAEEFKVRGELLERIWYERYEAEHPEAKRSNLDLSQQQMQEIAKENEKLKREALILKKETADNAYSLVWTGVGIGAAGLILTTAGGTLIGTMGEPFEVSKEKKVRHKGINDAGWAMIGAGIGLTVAGAIVAGIAGYQYTQATKDASENGLLIMDSHGLGLRF